MTSCHNIMSKRIFHKLCEGGDSMPSQTFLNLDVNKQKKLIDAAMIEFSNHEYPEVSINQIIMNAGISRGSFYMYFKDKDELFEYLIQINKMKLHELTKKVFIRNDGELYNSFLELYDSIVDYVVSHNYQGMFKNIFIYFDSHKKHFHKPGFFLFMSVKGLIKTDNLRDEELEFSFVMLLHHLFMKVTYCINNDCLDDKEQFIRKLNILCYGIYK